MATLATLCSGSLSLEVLTVLLSWLRIQDIIANKRLRLVGIVGLFPANAVGDDIEVYADESRAAVSARFYGLRQQAEKDGPESYYCLSDFIAPREGDVVDYLGMFANAGRLVTTGRGAIWFERDGCRQRC